MATKNKKTSVKKINHRTRVRHEAARGLSWLLFLPLAAVLIGVGGMALVQNHLSKSVIPPDQPEAGLSWSGLAPTKGSSECRKLYAIVQEDGTPIGCTHGPDQAPAGVDVRKSVQPLATAGSALTSGELEQGSAVCDGDGASGNRVQAIYARASDQPDRYDAFAASLQQYAYNANQIFMESGLQTGQAKSVRFVHDADCNLLIDRVTLSPTGDNSFSNTISQLLSHGYDQDDRKYMVWVDANVYCGIAEVYLDDRSTSDNFNNSGNLFARIDSGCWGGRTEAHELLHMMGGVQLSAPHATEGLHCTDESDRMCYKDGPENMVQVCAEEQESRFDCRKDDYFNTNPPSSSYLATHWNTANNRFLFSVGDPVSPHSGDWKPPRILYYRPYDESFLGRSLIIRAQGRDNVKVIRMEIYVDGVRKLRQWSHRAEMRWDARRTGRGSHTITIKAYDRAGNVAQLTRVVYKK